MDGRNSGCLNVLSLLLRLEVMRRMPEDEIQRYYNGNQGEGGRYYEA
jgi:hypothetical protein